eukprot:226122-Pleurochrysis_carterae.AAC.1
MKPCISVNAGAASRQCRDDALPHRLQDVHHAGMAKLRAVHTHTRACTHARMHACTHICIHARGNELVTWRS